MPICVCGHQASVRLVTRKPVVPGDDEIANNPRSRLHSQLDVGEYSQDTKIEGREPQRIHPDDAAPRGLKMPTPNTKSVSD